MSRLSRFVIGLGVLCWFYTEYQISFPFDYNWFFSGLKKVEAYLCPVSVAIPRFMCPCPPDTVSEVRLPIAAMASGNTCHALYYCSGVTHSQKCLGLEEKLYGSLGYIPEYPRKQVVPTVQSLLGPLGLLYSPFSAKIESRITCRTRKPNDPWSTVSLLGRTFDYTLPQKDRSDIHGWGTTRIILVDWKHFPNVNDLF